MQPNWQYWGCWVLHSFLSKIIADKEIKRNPLSLKFKYSIMFLTWRKQDKSFNTMKNWSLNWIQHCKTKFILHLQLKKNLSQKSYQFWTRKWRRAFFCTRPEMTFVYCCPMWSNSHMNKYLITLTAALHRLGIESKALVTCTAVATRSVNAFSLSAEVRGHHTLVLVWKKTRNISYYLIYS